MSSNARDYTEEQRERLAQAGMSMDYIPTEEEKKVLKECNEESFLYRSLPFSVISMGITQALVAKGALSASPRFGSLPKVAFAGFCGYLAGKVSYLTTCQEKFKRLENSPLGEILRQRAGAPPQSSKGPQSEWSETQSQSFESMFQPTEAPSQSDPNSRDYGYGYNPETPPQMGRADDFNAPAPPNVKEEEPRRKPGVLYEDLRLKNRENYEVTLTHKADTMVKAPPAREPEGPRKQVKKNIYGDTWEE